MLITVYISHNSNLTKLEYNGIYRLEVSNLRLFLVYTLFILSNQKNIGQQQGDSLNFAQHNFLTSKDDPSFEVWFTFFTRICFIQQKVEPSTRGLNQLKFHSCELTSKKKSFAQPVYLPYINFKLVQSNYIQCFCRNGVAAL